MRLFFDMSNELGDEIVYGLSLKCMKSKINFIFTPLQLLFIFLFYHHSGSRPVRRSQEHDQMGTSKGEGDGPAIISSFSLLLS